ncbi:hypothetical protein H0H81_001709 [Sphagnurus paluster]|uniref:Uncharacterized protein n=1 Tax=Sphagnurus paluster TaxID=117069 RepID=A0A9P7FPN5_9AGAR|nr:hypothetical protein H0H81_001709 [Sphagnurus paluster]
MCGSPSGSHLPLPALPSPPPPPSPLPQLTHSGQPQRNYAVPLWYQDVLPAPPVPSVQPDKPSKPEAPLLPCVQLIVRDHLVTALNVFGIWRDYPHRPSYDPDASISIADLAEKDLSFKDAPQSSLFWNILAPASLAIQ